MTYPHDHGQQWRNRGYNAIATRQTGTRNADLDTSFQQHQIQ